jgi:hypothetical protein
MAQASRHAYLQALGIDVWVPRAATANMARSRIEPDELSEVPASFERGLHIGPGDGNTLLLCTTAAEAATRLAADIARCLDHEPVWSWPMAEEAGQGISLGQAIEQRLFTRVLVFGPQLEEFVSGAAAQVIASARILRTRPITELIASAAAKRTLWSELGANHWCAERARET